VGSEAAHFTGRHAFLRRVGSLLPTGHNTAMTLDRADLLLLELLQKDGRATVQSLSEAIHLSARATLNRVRRLEKDGIINGYRALIARQAHGGLISVFAEVALKDQRQANIQRFERRMAQAHEVVACYVISGRYDYLAAGLPRHRALPHAHQCVARRRRARCREDRHQRRAADHQGIRGFSSPEVTAGTYTASDSEVGQPDPCRCRRAARADTRRRKQAHA
jgi:DNA-binding Lrp family transcriptional regulator